MTKLKLTKIGNSVGAVFPKDLLVRLHVDAGDTIFLTETSEGARITPYDPDFERQMHRATEIMKRRRRALRELAK